MRIGDLRHQITYQAPVRVADDMGGATVTWTDMETVWAAIWPVSANEQIQSAQPTMTISHRIRNRYFPGLKASWRIKYGTRYFNIVSIVNAEERNRQLD